MRDFKKRRLQKKDTGRFALRLVGVALLLVVTVAAAHSAWNMYGKLVRATQAQEETRTQLAIATAQTAQVEASVAALSSDRGVEAQMRERFGVARPGEGEITIVDNIPTATSTTEADQPWWWRLYHTLFVW